LVDWLVGLSIRSFASSLLLHVLPVKSTGDNTSSVEGSIVTAVVAIHLHSFLLH